MRTTSSKHTRPHIKSFSITCGVEMTTDPPAHNSALSAGDVSPVNIRMLWLGTLSIDFKKAACCSTKGFVGASTRTLPPYFSSLATITNSATIVLPRPVGSTTSEDRFSAALASED